MRRAGRSAISRLAATPRIDAPAGAAPPNHAAVVWREVARGEFVLDRAFQTMRRASHPWLLESTRVGPPSGRWSFAGADPWAVLRVRGRAISLDVRRAVRAEQTIGVHEREADLVDTLRGLLSPAPQVAAASAEASAGSAGGGALPPFLGGAVGWIGHEWIATFERVARSPAAPGDLPDATWLLVDRLLAFDHERGVLIAAGTGFGHSKREAIAQAERACDAAAAWERNATSIATPIGAGREHRDPVFRPRETASLPPPFRADCDAATYGTRVERIRQKIAAGDLYQACLTHRIEAPRVDAWALYAALRQESPAPFAAFLELPEVALAGSSPERFLRVTPDGVVESRPIKGTRPRGETPDEDARLRAALMRSEKDRAENVMIVDLVRNDLGRVCVPGSIEVPALCALETLSRVFQLVSTVRGRLARGHDALDAVRAAFPPGSMTGAPKLAAIDLLARLEPVRRGPYGGALGWIDARGTLDLSVVIRTAIVRRTGVQFQTGGGVVADSEALAEWCESLDKASAFFHAHRRASAHEARAGARDAPVAPAAPFAPSQ